jgi:hypothetical protein
MTYVLQGCLARTNVLSGRQIPGSRVIRLCQGMALVPFGEELLRRLGEECCALSRGQPLGASVHSLCHELSQGGRLIYFEDVTWGGLEVFQACARFENGEPAGEIVRSDDFGPVSEGLRWLGVTAAETDYDEFAAVGLGRFRETEDWLTGGRPGERVIR